jgi:hypothetical protein
MMCATRATIIIAATALPTPIPAAAPLDNPECAVEEGRAVAEVEGAEDEVEEAADEVDEATREVLVATNPEVIVKYATKEAGAGAANVSFVGASQSGLPLLSVPQQCHIWVVVFQTTSGLFSSSV